MDGSKRSWRAVPMLIGGAVGGVAVALLLNITAGAIDPARVSLIVRWGWLALIGVYFPIFAIYVSPAWHSISQSWQRARRRWAWLTVVIIASCLYLSVVRFVVDTTWARLRMGQQETHSAVAGAVPKSPPHQQNEKGP